MKQFLVCWDRDSGGAWVFDGSKWRFRGKSGGWIDSNNQDWKIEEFEHSLKVNNFKEK